MTPGGVFISYARADSGYASELHTMLREAGKRVWLDVQDIRPGVHWHGAVTHAIEQTDTFVFVVSPASLNSEWCIGELEIAVANGNVIVPIVLHDPEQSPVPASLASVNWIFARDGDERATARQRLTSQL